MNYDLDQGAGDGTRLGLVVLSTDETLEFEARALLTGQSINLMHTRIESAPHVTPESLADMEQLMTASAALLPAQLDAIGYGCTSASVMIGPDAVATQIAKAQPNVPVTNPISAVIAALHQLQTPNIALVTPYEADVVAPMRAFLERAGIETKREISFGERDDRRVARISEASTLAAMLEAGSAPGVQAVFSSCTNLRSFGVIDQAEAELGVPVISSNSALLWHLLALGGAADTVRGPGQLYTKIAA